MSDSESPRFEVVLNGETVGVAGVRGRGVLTAILCWAISDPARLSDEERARREALDVVPPDDFSLNLGGLDAESHLEWADCEIAVGDRIEIRVLPPGEVTSSRRHTPDLQPPFDVEG